MTSKVVYLSKREERVERTGHTRPGAPHAPSQHRCRPSGLQDERRRGLGKAVRPRSAPENHRGGGRFRQSHGRDTPAVQMNTGAAGLELT